MGDSGRRNFARGQGERSLGGRAQMREAKTGDPELQASGRKNGNVILAKAAPPLTSKSRRVPIHLKPFADCSAAKACLKPPAFPIVRLHFCCGRSNLTGLC